VATLGLRVNGRKSYVRRPASAPKAQPLVEQKVRELNVSEDSRDPAAVIRARARSTYAEIMRPKHTGAAEGFSGLPWLEYPKTPDTALKIAAICDMALDRDDETRLTLGAVMPDEVRAWWASVSRFMKALALRLKTKTAA